jgi:acyl-CoA synthetase (AMP-forming)/AMP-acid ligase II
MSTLLRYAAGFCDPAEAFLTHLRPTDAGGMEEQSFTRGEFWDLARKAAAVIAGNGLRPEDRFVLAMGGNQVGDLAFRLGAVMTGTVPVTTNWQADPIERVLYKIELTDCKLVLTDNLVDPKCVEAITARFPALPRFALGRLTGQSPLDEGGFVRELDAEATRLIIFTSGTTGQPKGVLLPYRSYDTNAATFESYLETKEARLANFIVNPMHHSNSSSLTDWSMRRHGTHLILLERYSTTYWRLLVETVEKGFDQMVAPLVARHFDFLESLIVSGQLPVERERLEAAMEKVDFLIGSAPVGPTTVKRLVSLSKRIPLVRFGSTETCLQVLGVPRSISEASKRASFQRGWAHVYGATAQSGFYIGRPHPPHTEARIVRSCEPDSAEYLVGCDEGEPGLLMTRGDNVMTGYVNDEAGTEAVFHNGWYSGLGDVCFFLMNPEDGERDFYWVSRESALMIRGGANYAYDQISDELAKFAAERFGLAESEFELAVVGLRENSEHEDECCVTIDLVSDRARATQNEMVRCFLDEARARVSKGSRPDHLRFDKIPTNFKGAVLVPELKRAYKAALN